MFVSVIVPAYKQEATIQEDVKRIYATMSQTRWQYEIIVVVDGMIDATYEKAKELEGSYGLVNLSVLGYKKNYGKGYAVRYGMARAKGDCIVFIDAGMDINPNGISMLLEHMIWYEADAIVASKRHPASKVKYTRMRKLYSWGYSLIIRLLFNIRLSDTQTGLKVFRRELLEKVLPRLVVKEFAFDIELLAVAHSLGFKRIFPAPVELHLDFSKNSKWKKSRPLFLDRNIRKMLIDTLAVFYRLRILNYYADKNVRAWRYDRDLDMRVNTGAFVYTQSVEQLSDKHVLSFSIIIPVRSVNMYLRENIEYLKKVEYQNFEVIIVVDALDNAELLSDERFKFIVSGSISPGEKRNLGARHATGEILAFLDDDAFPTKTWLLHAAKIFQAEDTYALGGPAVTPLGVSLLELGAGCVLESWLVSSSYVYRHLPRHSRFVDDYPTVNLFVKKEAFMAVGGFDSAFWPGEDTKLCLDLVNMHGTLFLYSPSPVVYHHRRKLLSPHLKQISRYGTYRGYFARVLPQSSRRLSYFIPSLFVTGLILGAFLTYLIPFFAYFYLSIIYFYLFLVFFESLRLSFRKGLSLFPIVFSGIIATHLTYGISFLAGLVKTPTLKLRGVDIKTGSYVGG